MKFNNRFDFQVFLFNLFFVFMMLAVGSVFISVPFRVFYSTLATQKAINKQCKTDYTFKEVLFASEDLLKLCQTKQQTITIK
jgi:hypothetical protein